MYSQIFTFCLLVCLTHSYLHENNIPKRKYSINNIENNAKPNKFGKYFPPKFPNKFSENFINKANKPIERFPVRYPENSVNNIEKEHQNSPNSLDYDDQSVKINGRMWGIDNELEMCKSRRVKINPLEDQEKDSLWQFLFINGTAAVEGEECVNPGGTCTLDIIGVKTKCIQKYSYKVLIHIEEGVQVEEKFRIPSGCVCVYNR